MTDAAYFGHQPVAELLLRNGADVNSLDRENKTVLDILDTYDRNSLDTWREEIRDLVRRHGGKLAKDL